MRIDHEESVKYYRSDASIPRKCAYCKNYVLQIEKEYPCVCAYLRTMSIDALRPFELFPPVEMKYGRWNEARSPGRPHTALRASGRAASFTRQRWKFYRVLPA